MRSEEARTQEELMHVNIYGEQTTFLYVEGREVSSSSLETHRVDLQRDKWTQSSLKGTDRIQAKYLSDPSITSDSKSRRNGFSVSSFRAVQIILCYE